LCTHSRHRVAPRTLTRFARRRSILRPIARDLLKRTGSGSPAISRRGSRGDASGPRMRHSANRYLFRVAMVAAPMPQLLRVLRQCHGAVASRLPCPARVRSWRVVASRPSRNPRSRIVTAIGEDSCPAAPTRHDRMVSRCARGSRVAVYRRSASGLPARRPRPQRPCGSSRPAARSGRSQRPAPTCSTTITSCARRATNRPIGRRARRRISNGTSPQHDRRREEQEVDGQVDPLAEQQRVEQRERDPSGSAKVALLADRGPEPALHRAALNSAQALLSMPTTVSIGSRPAKSLGLRVTSGSRWIAATEPMRRAMPRRR
jgi:hypothetical protein